MSEMVGLKKESVNVKEEEIRLIGLIGHIKAKVHLGALRRSVIIQSDGDDFL